MVVVVVWWWCRGNVGGGGIKNVFYVPTNQTNRNKYGTRFFINCLSIYLLFLYLRPQLVRLSLRSAGKNVDS